MALKRENVIRAAEKYVSKGKLEAAIKEYRKVLAENPNDANTLNRVGDLYARIERFDEAVKLFSQIAEQYTSDGFFVKAIAIYKKIIKLDPTALAVYERLAELYHKQGLLNEARSQYQILADYYNKHDNTTSATTIYLKMSQMEPDNPGYHLKLAELYGKQRLVDKAMKEYRHLADILIVGGSVDEATQVYITALEFHSEDLDFVREAVGGLRDNGHEGPAARVLAKAHELNPAVAQIAAELGGPEPEPVPEPAPEPTPEPVLELEESTHSGATASFAEPSSFDDSAVYIPGDDSPFGTGADPETEDLGSLTPDSQVDPVASGQPIHIPEATGEGLSLDEDFSFDLDDDEDSPNLVKPPDDLDDAITDTGSLELELEDDGIDAFEGKEDEDEATLFSAPVEEEEEDEVYDLGEIDLESDAAEALAAAEAAEMDADGAPGVEVDWSGDMDDLDLDLAASDHEPVEVGEAPQVGAETDSFVVELDGASPTATPVDTLDETAPVTAVASPVAAPSDEPPPEAVHRDEDLLEEARVFAKYGLKEKAVDRLSELLKLQPEHVGGLQLQARMDLEAGRHEAALEGANRVGQLASTPEEQALWQELKQDLSAAGFAVDKQRVVNVPGQKPAEDDRIAQLLEDLSLEDFGGTTGAHPPYSSETPTPSSYPPSPTADPLPSATAVEADEVFAAAPVTTAADGTPLISLIDELGLDELDDELDDVVAARQPAPATAPPSTGEDALDETGMSWLDDVTGGAEQPSAQVDSSLFDEESDFFDLAAELERELDDDELSLEDGIIVQPQEQTLEDIIEGFKQGVAENLSPEDYDTHYNLGIAYREMGLLDEAIGEFQLASKDSRYLVDCSSNLGQCFLEKGLPELAVRWYRKALEAPNVSDEASLGLLYDMADAYLSTGDNDSAYKTLVEIYGLNSNYRDVTAKLQELRSAT